MFKWIKKLFKPVGSNPKKGGYVPTGVKIGPPRGVPAPYPRGGFIPNTIPGLGQPKYTDLIDPVDSFMKQLMHRSNDSWVLPAMIYPSFAGSGAVYQGIQVSGFSTTIYGAGGGGCSRGQSAGGAGG